MFYGFMRLLAPKARFVGIRVHRPVRKRYLIYL